MRAEKQKVSYCRDHGLLQGLAGASEDHVSVGRVLQGWEHFTTEVGHWVAKQGMTAAARERGM